MRSHPLMSSWRPILAITALALGAACRPAPSPDHTADLLLINGRVYTFTWPDPDRDGAPSPAAPYREGRWTHDADWVAMRRGQILATGRGAPPDSLRGSGTDVRDLHGDVVLPGFVESHGHYTELGESATEVDLSGVTTEAELVRRVLAFAKSAAPGEWIVGSGWDEGEWANHLPTEAPLTAALPNTPVVLKGRRGFGILGNRAALSAAGITRDTRSPSGGEIVHDARGEPTGVLLNRAVPLLKDAIPVPSLDKKKRIVREGLLAIQRAGYVTGHHAGVYADYLPAYVALAAADSLPVRVQLMLAARAGTEQVMQAAIAAGPTKDLEAWLQQRGVKAYYDGSLGSRGAKLLADYSDQPGTRGVAGAAYGFPDSLVEAAMLAGFQVGIHAIGDGGNHDVLDFYQAVFARHPELRARRHRIEHAQVIAPDDFARFGALGLVASMEPPHAVEDAPWAEQRLGPVRVRGAYAWRTLRRNGVTLIFNSDLRGSDYAIFYGLHGAVTRTDRTGAPTGGWYPEQAVTPEEAVRAYTVWPAYASGLESRTGTIAPGRWADLTVVSIDPLNVGTETPAALLDGRVRMTVIGGRVAFVDTTAAAH